jgi:hypothetical protein
MPLTSPRFSDSPRLQAAADNRPPLRKGETGEAVETLQQALIDLGFAMPISTRRKGSPDGIYGDETAQTVWKFQAQQGLQKDGGAGRQTLGRLDQLFQAAPDADNEAVCLFPNSYDNGHAAHLTLGFAIGAGVSAAPAPPALTPVAKAKQDVPEALRWVIRAMTWLREAIDAKLAGKTLTGPVLDHFNAIDVHFHVQQKVGAFEQCIFMNRVRMRYGSIKAMLDDPDKYFGDDFNVYPTDNDLSRAWAHAPIGGFHNGKDEKKVRFRPKFLEVTGQHCRIAMILHECAHSAAFALHYADDWPFPTGTKGFPHDKDHQHARDYQNLLADEALTNAYSYPSFAANAKFERDERPGAHDLTT